MFDLPQNSFYMMAAIIGLLALSTIIGKVAAPKNRELSEQIRSWWWMILILLTCLTIGKTITVTLFGFISFLALKEFSSIVPMRQADRRVLFWAYLSIPIQYYFVATAYYPLFLVFIPVWAFLLLPMRMVVLGNTKGFIRSAGIMQWAVMLTVFCLSHIAYLLMLPVKNEQAGGIGVILFLIFTTEFNDICQYIWGKSLGKKKILPTVSPNKTWIGFLGGLATITVLSAFLGPVLLPLEWAPSMFAGFIISIAGFTGDVVLSAIKRDLDIKDSGSMIPGHGGILDRLDSLIYASPVFFHYLYYMAY